MKYVIGIDEAGRGALAGPVSVGAALVPHDFDWSLIPGVKDSKQLSPKRREEIYDRACSLRREGLINFSVSLIREKIIDSKGITEAVLRGVSSSIKKLDPDPETVFIRLDGLLRAPHIYEQETIIKGDALVPAISLASIVAKVTRDRYMVRLGKKYPRYSFSIHKGYGTLTHRTALKESGISAVHRKTFCRLYGGI